MNKLAIVVALLICVCTSHAQSVSLETNIKTVDKEWPVCSRPTHLKTEVIDGFTKVSWDAIDDPSQYEVKLVQEQSRAVMLEATVSTNFVSLDEQTVLKDKDYFVKVRRRCQDIQNNLIYSDWVVQAITNNQLDCSCYDFNDSDIVAEYQQIGTCLFVQFDALPCTEIETGASYMLIIESDNDPSYPQYVNLQGQTNYQVTLAEGVTITSVEWSWRVNSNSGCEEAFSLVSTNFDIDESIFDLSDCGLNDPCTLPQYLSANQVGDDVILSIEGISQQEFNDEILGVSSANLHVSGWSSTGYTEFIVPYYNASNNTDIANWQGVLGLFTGATEINIHLVYSDVDGNTITCSELYTIPISVDSLYCEILQLLLPSNIDDNKLVLSYADSTNLNYLSEELSLLGLTVQQAYNLFRANIREIRYKLLNTNQIIYVTGIDQLQLTDYYAEFDPVQIDEDFIGTVEIEYIYYDTSSDFCYITPITFDLEEVPENVLPDYECDSVYDLPIITNQTLLDNVYAGDMVVISGISFIINSIAGTNGNYSGSGFLAIPFSGKNAVVTFHSLSVNDEYEAFTGEVNGEMGDPSNYPDFYIEPDTFSIGGEICLPPPPPPNYDGEGFNTVTGLNDRGFGQDSIHHVTNSRYDPKGFDISGNHKATGTPFDEAGCDMTGYDEFGNLCQGDSTIVTAFIDSVNQTIVTDVTAIVDDLIDSLTISLGNDCSGLRTEVSSLITSLGFDASYIVGENNEYLDPGMSNNFVSEPLPLVLNTDRDDNVELLETKHVELYHCDKNHTKISKLLTAIQSVSTDDIIELVKDEMEFLTNYQVDDFKSDPVAFQEWIVFTIERLLKENYGISSSERRYNDSPLNLNAPDPNPWHNNSTSDYYSTASLDDIYLDVERSIKKENYWLFNQGRQDIKGLDRGLYLEELYNQMLVGTNDNEVNVMFPIRIRKEIDNTNYDIYLDGLTITPAGASINATFIFTEPNSGKKIIFKATGLAFGTGGILGESKLSLNTAIELRLSNAAMLRINPGENTFVSWDCTGFTSLGFDADIELCRNLIVPLAPVTYQPLPDPQRYSVNFIGEISSWSDIYLSVNDTANGNIERPFSMAGYPDMIWRVQDLTFDFSDKRSPQNVILNPDYISPHVNGSNLLSTWRGVYLRQLDVLMKSEFKADGSDLRIFVDNIVIDDTGVSGVLSADNVLAYEDGNLSGWQMSIEDLSISVLQNHINGGGMGGKINVPVIKNPMDYTATIFPGGYYDFIVKPNLTDSMDLYAATVVLDSNSYIQARVEPDNEFLLKATLHGKISIDKELGGVDIKYNDIRFDNFEISNQSPYFSPGSWQFPNSIGADLYGFGINLININQFKNPTDEKEVGISTIIDLNLAEALGIKAAGAMDIIGKMHEDQFGRQKWKYDRVEMNQFAVDAEFSAGHIYGSISKFDKHNTYGNGFQGMLEAEFTGVGAMTAMGLFGNVGEGSSNYKYFFVDALVDIAGTGIPAGPLSINGFAGGVSYHMDRDYSVSNLQNAINTSALPPIGSSFSGTDYTPNVIRGLGLKAGALISTAGTKSLFNGMVSFGILFNESDTTGTGGGVEEMDFNGMGQFLSLSPVNSSGENQDTVTAPNINSSLTTYIDLNYNFTQNVFDGKFSCFLNTPGDFIKGGMDDYGKMVDAAAYFGPDKWYIYLGTPDAPCEVAFKIPGVNIRAIVDSYLDVGTDVPDMNPIPSNVSKIASKISKNRSIRSSGAGFVFGSRFDLDAKMNFGIASGELKAGVGFDLMVRNYPGAYCLGNHPSDEIGFNGWYGMGQMWAYVEGKVKIFGVSVLEAGIAAVLQAQLPNPTFAQATVGVKFKAMFKTWKKSLKVAIGEQCTIISESTDNEIGMNVIQYIDPISGTKDIEVDAQIRVITAIALDEVIKLPTLNDPSVLHEFKAELDEVIMYGNYGSYNLEPYTSDSGTELFFGNTNQFYEDDSITAIVRLKISKDGVEIGTESDTTTFIVGQAYNFIPESNIAAAYPLDGMSNFYKEEYNRNKGYILLKQGMPELFYNDDYTILAQLISDDGEEHIVDIEYLPLERKVEFDLDPAILNNDKLYKLNLIEVEEGHYNTHTTASSNTANLNSYMSNSNHDSGRGLDDVEARELYASVFRVSIFDTFEDKIDNALQPIIGLNYLVDEEVFDDIEIDGRGEFPNLISLQTNFSSLYKEKIGKIYNQVYPIQTLNLITTQSQMFLPKYCDTKIGENFDFTSELVANAVGFDGLSQSIILEEDFGSYNYNAVGTQTQYLKFKVHALVTNHWKDIKLDIIDCLGNLDDIFDSFNGNEAFSTGADGSTTENHGEIELQNEGLQYIYESYTPVLSQSDKNIFINYTTPGGIHTSSFRIQF